MTSGIRSSTQRLTWACPIRNSTPRRSPIRHWPQEMLKGSPTRSPGDRFVMMASSGSAIFGSGTSVTWTSSLPCHVRARFPGRFPGSPGLARDAGPDDRLREASGYAHGNPGRGDPDSGRAGCRQARGDCTGADRVGPAPGEPAPAWVRRKERSGSGNAAPWTASCGRGAAGRGGSAWRIVSIPQILFSCLG